MQFRRLADILNEGRSVQTYEVLICCFADYHFCHHEEDLLLIKTLNNKIILVYGVYN